MMGNNGFRAARVVVGHLRHRFEAGVMLHMLALCLLAPSSHAEPVELHQGSEVGAGTAFRRGEVCMVLTAAHVVKEQGVEVVVFDRTGGRARGEVTYSNPTYDIALVTLKPGFAVPCTERWPDTGWMASAKWNSRSMLEAIRHYPNGREAVIGLRWSGGSDSTLSLARVDRMEIRSSDSGALVRQEDRLAGIIKEVDTAVDRVEVVRFDVIDRLVGDRFRGAGASAVSLEGVIWRGRPHPNWTSYVGAWLTDSAKRPLVDRADPQSRCRIRAEVIEWSQRNVENQRYTQLQQGLGTCRTNLLFRNSATAIKFCEEGYRNQLKEMPRTQRVHSIQLKVDIWPRTGSAESKLRSVELLANPGAGAAASEVELQMMQRSFGEVAKEMLASGVCG